LVPPRDSTRAKAEIRGLHNGSAMSCRPPVYEPSLARRPPPCQPAPAAAGGYKRGRTADGGRSAPLHCYPTSPHRPRSGDSRLDGRPERNASLVNRGSCLPSRVRCAKAAQREPPPATQPCEEVKLFPPIQSLLRG
jgi:hypothetical protein